MQFPLIHDLEILDPEIAPEQFSVQKCRQTICPVVNAFNRFICLTSFVQRVSAPLPPIHVHDQRKVDPYFLHFMYSAALIIPILLLS